MILLHERLFLAKLLMNDNAQILRIVQFVHALQNINLDAGHLKFLA